MSRHQAVRNLDYEEVLDEYDADDYEDENEGEQLSAEDRQAMAEGTQFVRSSLGSDADKVTTQQIQDALWHYFYDIEKSVSYLKKKFIDPPPKQEPKKTKDDGMGLWSWDDEVLEDAVSDSHAGYPVPRIASLTAASYFHGISWMGIPQSRQAILTPPQPLPGGLLGGGEGPKLSKLQALAAARKKKTDVKKDDDKVDRAEKRMSSLAITEPSSKESGSGLLAKRQKLSGESTPQPSATSQLQTSSSDAPSGMDVDLAQETPAGNDELTQDDCFVVPSTRPSAFAQTLFGPSQDSADASQTYSMPYTTSSSFVPSAFTQPSPDDIVLAAQAKAGNKFDAAAAKSATKKVAAKSKANEAPAGEMKQLQLDDSAAPKNKKLDVLKEFEKSDNKRSASFVVVGHVDAGKSTLMGRLLLELKFVEQHLVDRYRRQGEKIGKASFALAWVMDQREEERERGVTIDIATNQFETDKTRFTILDAPGHRDFVPNMIAGASQADFAILVIDANTGAFEKGLKGQTREHALLLRSLGVQRVIVAVNKLDMVGWSKDRFDEISEQVTGFMKGNGFQLKNVTFVPISGLNGDNLVTRPEDEALSWYTGPTLIEALEDSEPMTRALQKPFRMSISEIFRSQQSQLTVAGRIESGTVQNGESLIVQPSGEPASIRSIEVDSEPQEWAVAGQSVNIGLYGIDPIHVRVGDIISTKAAPIDTSDTLTMKVLAFDHLMPQPVDVHRGRLHAAGRIEAIPAVLDKVTGATVKKNPKIVQPAKVARVVVRLESKVPLEAGQRVVLRSGGETIAAGLLE
ncbi:HBS1-like protein [Colletotrichum fructicola]|uniref:Elongation factor 1 alpha-like protein n=1 Tax=Colletotrichum fructicola (strain Nara gc5) TaxID=1213859 RepID=L2FLY8_COLFN|nr:HBS1-like protein [Colletotrichum fructicola]KAF4492704.1 HBS1-like protein [Colletotrichum fructicola Nara gc5]KAE9576060.1 HBS1-like protein [Colletotrichum fructicola]KAF4427092.1 HBS1-like protein [Colletotrichum fructicola]KAF4899634.1 HBS1-like protein [Colletotrichum fructicola]KAF4900294.1 HBS1-like protein [Colletotrichum fructicola]